MRLFLIAVVLAGLLASPAAASSVVYEQGGDVWLAGLDGGDVRRVTSGGGYREPSQADDGTIVAAYGTRLRRLRPDGTVLSDIPTIVLDHPNWFGPLDPDVSPDGTKVVYTWEYQHLQDTTPCPLTESDCRFRTRWGGAVVSWSDRATEERAFGYLYSTGELSWIDDFKLLTRDRMTGSAGWTTLPAGEFGPEFWYSAGMPLSDGSAPRTAGMVAWVTGADAQLITIWRTAAGVPGSAKPTTCLQLAQPAGRFADPTWSPDGTQLLWQEDSGIWGETIPADCLPGRAQPRLLIPGGRSPDVGPGNTPPPPPVRRPPVDPPPVERPVERVPAARAPRLALLGKAPTLRQLSKRRTLTLRLTCDGACDVRLTASVTSAVAKRLRLKTPALASAKSSGRGARTVKLTLSRGVASALAKQKAVAVTVTGSGSYGGGSRAAPRLKLTLKR